MVITMYSKGKISHNHNPSEVRDSSLLLCTSKIHVYRARVPVRAKEKILLMRCFGELFHRFVFRNDVLQTVMIDVIRGGKFLPLVQGNCRCLEFRGGFLSAFHDAIIEMRIRSSHQEESHGVNFFLAEELFL